MAMKRLDVPLVGRLVHKKLSPAEHGVLNASFPELKGEIALLSNANARFELEARHEECDVD
jgi:hypothetical protein